MLIKSGGEGQSSRGKYRSRECVCSKKNKREREREVGGGGGVQSMDIIIKYYIVSTGEKNMPYRVSCCTKKNMFLGCGGRERVVKKVLGIDPPSSRI